MNIHYTGRQVDVSEAQKKKLESKFQKIQKILKRHEPEAHVIVSLERHLYVAEVTLNFQHHTMVVECAAPELPNAVQEAVEKLEKQIVRNKDKWREKKRRPKPVWEMVEAETPPRPNGGSARTARWTSKAPRTPTRAPAGPGAATAFPRIFRNAATAAKPLTVEEAVLELEEGDRDCIVYQDAEKGRLAVLFRRRDGNLELVEA